MVGKYRNMSADMLIMPGLLAFNAADHLLCVRSQSVRDLVTEISAAVPRRHRCGVAQS